MPPLELPERTKPLKRQSNDFWLFLILVVYLVLCFTSAPKESFTMDEFGNIFSGYRIVRCGDYNFLHVNPPLVRLAFSAPWWGVGGPEGCGENPVGHKKAFVRENARILPLLHRFSKSVVILLGIIGCLYAYRLLASLQGERAGLYGVALLVLNPSVLAYARFCSIDFTVSVFGIAFLYHLLRWTRQACFRHALASGVWMGFVLSAKFSGVVFFFFFLVVAVYTRLRFRHVLAFLVGTFFAVHVVHFFHGTLWSLDRVGPYHSNLFKKLTAVLPGWLPRPWPAEYVRGFDFQMHLNSLHFPQSLRRIRAAEVFRS